MRSTCPGTPGRATAVAGDTQAVITVSQPATGSSPPTSGGTPTSYTVTASPGGATCTVTGANGSCTITGLTNGTSYTFTSTATNATGTSAPSVASLSTTPASAPPTLSSSSSSAVATTTATLNFTSNEAGTYYYLIYAAADSPPSAAAIAAQGDAVTKGTSSALAAANAVNVTGLSPGTAYKAYVIVKDADTNASLVTTIDLTTKPSTPSAPDLADASDTGSSSTDNTTADNTPTFDLSGLTVGATVTLTATPASGTPVNCVFTAVATTGSCTFSPALVNQTYSVAVKQTINSVDSAAATLASVVINTTTIATPATPDLVAGSDLGTSSTDNTTSDNTPTFTVAGSFTGTAVLTASKAGSTSVSCTLSSGTCTLTTLGDGAWVVTVTDTDSSGNSATSTGLTVTIDATAPTAPASLTLAAASDSGASSSDLITSNTSLVFTGTAEANSIVQLYVGGVATGSTCITNVIEAFSCTTGTLSAGGDRVITAVATDAAGNSSSASTSATVNIDTAAPTVTATTGNVVFGGNAVVQSSESGTVYLVNTSVTVTNLASITSAADASWNSASITSASTNTNLAVTGLSAGTYKAYAVDTAGNLSLVSTATVTVLQPPQLIAVEHPQVLQPQAHQRQAQPQLPP